MQIRLAGTVAESIVDGPGYRYAVFVQGCPHHCPGCHNPGTHDFAGGYLTDTQEIIAQLGKNPLVRGVTLSALYHIINERRNAGRAIVVTTNCDSDQLYEK